MVKMTYDNCCEFYEKADYEGGIAEMVLGYGVGKDDVPRHVYMQVMKLNDAYRDLLASLGIWHGEECSLEDGQKCPWG